MNSSIVSGKTSSDKYLEENKEHTRASARSVGRHLTRYCSEIAYLERQKLLAWCCDGSNEIRVYDYQNQQEYCSFNGARLPMNLKITFSLKCII